MTASVTKEFAQFKIHRIAVLPVVERFEQATGDLGDLMTETIHARLTGKSPWQVVSATEVRATIKQRGKDPLASEAWQARIGSLVFADSVLFGEIVTARERIGGEYGIQSPASIHFVLSLLDVERKKVIWRAEFQETQQSLTDNLLFFLDFFSKGAKWLTVNELMDIGVEKTIDSLVGTAKRPE